MVSLKMIRVKVVVAACAAGARPQYQVEILGGNMIDDTEVLGLKNMIMKTWGKQQMVSLNMIRMKVVPAACAGGARLKYQLEILGGNMIDETEVLGIKNMIMKTWGK